MDEPDGRTPEEIRALREIAALQAEEIRRRDDKRRRDARDDEFWMQIAVMLIVVVALGLVAFRAVT